MLLGIIAGFAAALFQSFSYLCSRKFMLRHNSSWLLVVYSQFGMGLLGLLTLPFADYGRLFASPGDFTFWMIFWLVTITLGQVSFFCALKEIEASKLSSLLGLKIIVLAAIFLVIFREKLNFWQYFAIILSATAALLMNWSGGARFSLRGILFLAGALVTYSLADIAETRLVRMVAGGSLISDGVTIGAVCYFLLGIITLPALKFIKFDRRLLTGSFPFAIFWYYAMTALFVCFAGIGTVFGNVIHASRGIISVALGVLVVKLGDRSIETPTDRKGWLRRLAAATLMLIAIAIYSLASQDYA